MSKRNVSANDGFECGGGRLGRSLEADLFTWKSWRLTQFFELIENDYEVFIVGRQLANNSSELPIEFFVRLQPGVPARAARVGWWHLSQLYEGAHDCDVDLDGSF